jgi:hypothetical protein
MKCDSCGKECPEKVLVNDGYTPVFCTHACLALFFLQPKWRLVKDVEKTHE